MYDLNNIFIQIRRTPLAITTSHRGRAALQSASFRVNEAPTHASQAAHSPFANTPPDSEHRSLLSSVHGLRLRRGENRRHITPSPALIVESIQPKHNASSTASRYCSPSRLLVIEIHISRFVEWFSTSQSRHCSREVVCNLSVISILSAYLLQS